jgi:hypothetical protein
MSHSYSSLIHSTYLFPRKQWFHNLPSVGYKMSSRKARCLQRKPFRVVVGSVCFNQVAVTMAAVMSWCNEILHVYVKQ